jgi:hypothetical protein
LSLNRDGKREKRKVGQHTFQQVQVGSETKYSSNTPPPNLFVFARVLQHPLVLLTPLIIETEASQDRRGEETQGEERRLKERRGEET